MKTIKLILSLTFFTLLIIGCASDIDNSNKYETDGDEYYDGKDLEQEYTESSSESLTNSFSNTQKVSQVDSKNGYNQGTASINKNETLSTDELKANNLFTVKIIRNADLKFKVKNVKKLSAKIADLVDISGGYISSEDLISDKSYYQTLESTEASEIKEYEVATSNIIYIRVPTKNFQTLISSMKGLSISEDYVKINAEDVTEEYYDLETRLKTKKEVEARYINILKSKAKTLNEILIAEDKIRVIREEIEAVEGRLIYLKNKVSLSTIQVEIYQDTYYTQETTRYKKYESTGWSFGEKAADAISTGWDGILLFFIGLLYFWPLFLIGGGVLWFVRRRIRKKRALKK
jgi:hypothetical protein